MPRIYDSASYSAVPVGATLPIPSTGVPFGYMVCNGFSLSRSVYAALFAAIGTAHGFTDGSSFNIPDYRGVFLRGMDTNRGVDAERASRTASNTGGNTGDAIGSIQGHAFLSHNHGGGNHSHGLFTGDGGGSAGDRVSRAYTNNGAAGQYNVIYGSGVIIGTEGATENRPINVNTNYMIRVF